jgi:hypothetical protein
MKDIKNIIETKKGNVYLGFHLYHETKGGFATSLVIQFLSYSKHSQLQQSKS